MGVTGLWSLLSPVGRQIEVKVLANKKLAIDASIWIVQFLKAMRMDDGTILHNAHLLGFFRRICRLLFHGVKPVFVFDGGTPELKKRTIKARRKRRNLQSTRLKRTAERILLRRLKRRLKEEDSTGQSSTAVKSPVDALMESEEEEEEEELESEEELDFATVDKNWLFSLPPSQQYEHLVQMRDKQFASNRQLLSSVTGKPQEFSETQMDLFLKSSSIRQELQEMRRTVGGVKSGRAQKLANDPNRVFIYSPGEVNAVTSPSLMDPKSDQVSSKASSKTVFPLDGTKTIVQVSQEFEERKRKTENHSNAIHVQSRQIKNISKISDDEIEWESIKSSSDIDEPVPIDELLEAINANEKSPSSPSHTEDQVEPVEDQVELVEDQITSSESEEEVEELVLESKESSIVRLTNPEAALLDETIAKLEVDVVRHSKQVDGPTEEMFIECQQLLRLFGIPYIIAPMEAEAQCAFLNQQNLVDGVITEDSDVFLFGAQKVYKNLFNDQKYVEEYLMEDIEEELGLSRDRIVDLAMLLGSDYTEGIRGIGIVNSMEILSAFSGPNGLKDFAKWARENALEEEVLELTKQETLKEEGLEKTLVEVFKEKHKELRRSWEIPDTFPNEFVKRAYCEPAVDGNLERFTFAKPNTEQLCEFCKTKFNWNETKFDDVLSPVLKANSEKLKQGTIDVFLTERRRFAKIKSQRLQEAVVAITGKYDPEMMVESDSLHASVTRLPKKRRLV